MKKKKIVHFTWAYLNMTGFAACGADGVNMLLPARVVKTTNHRDRVTCKRCKATRRFRKVK